MKEECYTKIESRQHTGIISMFLKAVGPAVLRCPAAVLPILAEWRQEGNWAMWLKVLSELEKKEVLPEEKSLTDREQDFQGSASLNSVSEKLYPAY